MIFESSPVIEEGYWRTPLDCPFYMTHHGQLFQYFHQHVHQSLKTNPEESFTQCQQLPLELQLRIMRHCNAPTLFQLMHTTRDIRIEASKLFFANPAVWYRLESEFLLQKPSNGESLYEPCFMASIKQLEVHCPFLTSRSWRPDPDEETFESFEDRRTYIEKHIELNIQAFWTTVQRLCPQVRRIMFTQDGSPIPDEDTITDCFRKMTKSCPPSLDVFLYRAEPAQEAVGRRRGRVLQRLSISSASTVTESTLQGGTPSRAPIKIVVPPEKPHRGRVGDFIASQRAWERYCAQRFAADYHRAAVVEQYHFQGRHEPFGCSVAECDAWFDQPEQYTTHLLATGHGTGKTPPGQAEEMVAAYARDLMKSKQKSEELHLKFWDWWELEDSHNPPPEEEVLHQLEHDVLYAQDKPVSEHALYRLIWQVMMETQL
ncbi:hypothetical protein E8E13_000252 [Curvularia kusanoi]|uniref:C2H2-type domain-containing protein n=1 Tax=Curvularia kusanoi TaxID=90978 RepID=A0A9P4W5H8_CURKU|nr:hypothetical protein E8E13_000252 [Curvularia kusanoi]